MRHTDQPGTCPGSQAADLQAAPLIASNQKDDLAELPTPREGYQWVKVEVRFPSDIQEDDRVWIWQLNNERGWHCAKGFEGHSQFACGMGWVARQVPTPEPEGPEVILGPKSRDSVKYRVFADGTLEFFAGSTWRESQYATSIALAADYASLYAKDKANTALLDKFFELGERAAAFVEWQKDDEQSYDTMPESSLDVINDLAKAYKEAKGDAKQDV